MTTLSLRHATIWTVRGSSLTFFAGLFIIKLNVIDEATTQVLSVPPLKSDPSDEPR